MERMIGKSPRTTDLPWPPDLIGQIPISERCVKLANRIISNCSVEDRGFQTPCWEWQGGHVQSTGGKYGRISVDSSMELTHRVIWSCFHGFIPRKKQIDHLCKNTICCNPDHLELVTNRQNQKRKAIIYDQIARGNR